MQKVVETVITACKKCVKNKTVKYIPYRKIKILRTPDKVWSLMAWDFIVKLPKSKKLITEVEYNLILVITDRLIKYAYFLLYLEALNTEELAYVFLRTIIRNHRMPEEIISNRDKLFILKF